MPKLLSGLSIAENSALIIFEKTNASGMSSAVQKNVNRFFVNMLSIGKRHITAIHAHNTIDAKMKESPLLFLIAKSSSFHKYSF